MKNFCLIVIVVFLGSCVSDSVNKNNSEQIIMIMTNHNYLVPDVSYRMIPQNGRIRRGKSNDDGLIILKATNSSDYNIELDFDTVNEVEKRIDEVFTEEDVKNFEIVYLKHQNDVEIITYVDGYKMVEIEHDYECRDDYKYNLTLENGKNYLLIFQVPSMDTISM